MGTNNLSSIGASIVRAVGNQLDQYFTALSESFVPRNSSGVPDDNIQSLGLIGNRWKNLFSGNIKVEGNTISSTDTNGDINITPDGTGKIVLGGGLFGDKSDGASVTISAATSMGGIKQYGDLTIDENITVAGSKNLTLLVDGTLTINANIIGTGVGASGGAGGTGLTVGNKGTNGVNGGGSGGSGGCKLTDTSGGAGGSVIMYNGMFLEGGFHFTNSNSGTNGKSNNLGNLILFLNGYGAGGGSGSDSGGTNASGAGGNGGAGVLIIAREIIVTGSRSITCNGNAGSSGTNDNGGGGAGGGGGNISVYYLTQTDIASLTTTASGGAGGSGAGGGRNGGAGGNGLIEVKQIEA